MKYSRERMFIVEHMHKAFDLFAVNATYDIRQKTQFDLVTNIDTSIESYLSEVIRSEFPEDRIHGEEMSSKQEIIGRTWTIDPIDGTCNMAKRNPIYGIQCALFDCSELVLGVIYLPFLNETYWAVSGEGCYLNDQRIVPSMDAELNNAVISVGDYTHKSEKNAQRQHKAIGLLYPQIAKIRMFGAACVDFSFVAAGRTDGTIVITKNIWDIAPGIALCKEVGAQVTNLEGEPFHFGDDGVVVSSNHDISMVLRNCLSEDSTISCS